MYLEKYVVTAVDKGRPVGLLTFFDMKLPNGLLVFLKERTRKFLAFLVKSVVLGSLR